MFGKKSSRRRRVNRDWTIPVLESRVLPSAVSVRLTPASDGTVNLSFRGTPQDDTIHIERNESGEIVVSASNMLSVNGGPAQSSLTVPGLRDLEFQLGAGNDMAFVTDVSANRVRILDGLSSNENGHYAFSSYYRDVSLGDVDAYFDRGRDFRLYLTTIRYGQSPPTMTVKSVTVTANQTTSLNTLLGATGGYFRLSGAFSVNSFGANSTDEVAFDATSNSTWGISRIELNGGVNINLGGAADQVKMAGPVIVNGQININTGAGDDRVELNEGGFNQGTGITLNGNVAIITGHGQDWVILAAHGTPNRTKVTGNAIIATGTQNDIVQITGALFEKQLTIAAGSSDGVRNPLATADVISIGNTEVVGNANIGSTGLANVHLFAAVLGEANPQTQPMRFRSAARFAIGSGFIDASLVFDPVSKIIFDKTQTFIGLNETITVKYGDAVMADPLKRRLINAVLA